MKIVFFSHYFPPEGNAPASRTYDHCARWVRSGHDVTVITCAPNVPSGKVYEGYKNRLWPQKETVDGIKVVRVWTYLAANAGGAKRILNFLSYVFSALFAFVVLTRRPNIIIATSPQFFCGWTGVIASWIKWRPFILEIRDTWPEAIVVLGAMKEGMLTRFLIFLEKRMYRSATHIVAVGNGYKHKILEKAPQLTNISIITNGVDLDRFQQQPRSDEFLRRFQLDAKFVCSYVGTIGMAHKLEVVLDAAEILRQKKRNDIAFCLVGDGALRSSLEEQANERGLEDMVRFTGRLSKEQMPIAIASSDALLVHLKRCDLYKTVIPSKIFEAMAMGRPIIMGVAGESAEIVARSGGGIEMEPENAVQLVDAVCRIADDEELRLKLSQSGRPFVAENYTRDVLAARMLRIIETVANRKRVEADAVSEMSEQTVPTK